jgi:hypothetical protein
MIAYCGLECTGCPAYLATLADDDHQRRKVAQQWSNEYKSDIKPEDINCEGCLPGGSVYFTHCRVCEIRACGVDRGLQNCGYCDDFACEKLERFLELVPDARRRLTEIRSGA